MVDRGLADSEHEPCFFYAIGKMRFPRRLLLLVLLSHLYRFARWEGYTSPFPVRRRTKTLTRSRVGGQVVARGGNL